MPDSILDVIDVDSIVAALAPVVAAFERARAKSSALHRDYRRRQQARQRRKRG